MIKLNWTLTVFPKFLTEHIVLVVTTAKSEENLC